MITYGSITLTSYNSIVTTTIYYYQSISPTDLIGGTWSTTKPEWEEGTYVWQKLRTIYEDGTFSEGDAVNITGQQGKSGEAASSYKLTSSESAIALLKTGEYSTNQITFNATYKQGNNPIAPYNGGFVIQYSTNGAEWVTDYTSLNNESSKTYTIPENILIIKCLLYQTKDCDELLDIVTIPIIKDGIDGTGVTNSFPIYLVSDKDKGITFDDHGWTRFKPSLDAENKYLWIDYVSRYAKGNTKPQLIEKTGNKITFEYHGERSPFESVIIDITPVQSGSGTPSSRNKRHISGWTSIDIGQADINLMSYEEGKYMLDLPEDIATLDNQTLNLENTMFTIQGDTLIITKGDLGTHITFPEEVGTVYGGKYNVTTGVLMVTHGYIDKYNNEPLPSTWISDRNVYVKGTKPSIDAQVVFELNEPLIYELTPQEIMIFEHSNSIYASTGDISISYYDYQTTTSPYIDYALVSAFDASTAALEEATQLKQDFQELQEDIQTQLDQKVETWCQINDPALSWTTTDLKQQHNGDLWYYIGKSNISYKNNTTYKYVASTGEWMPYAVSADLFDKIDGKAAIYYGTISSVTSAEEGDYLVDSTDGSSYRWDGSKWVKVTDYKTAIDNIEIGGRNLARNTKDAIIDKTESAEGSRAEYAAFDLGCALPLNDNDNISISFDLYMVVRTANPHLNVYNTNNKGVHQTCTYINVLSGNSYQVGDVIDKRVAFVSTIHDRESSTLPHDYLEFYSEYGSNNFFRISNLKVEKGNKPTDWTPAPEDVTSSIQAYVDTLQFQVDHMAEIYYGTAVPTLSNTPASDWNTNDIKDIHIDDLYYNTSTGYCYRFMKSGSTYSWTRIKDSDITAAATAASNANTAAGNAQTTANNANTLAGQKRRIFVAQPTPPYEVGDLWVEGSNGDIKKCKTARATGSYTVSDWELASKYTDDTLANEANDKIDNLEIGGRNYKQNSNFSNKLNKWSSWNGATVTIDKNIENKNWAHVTMGANKAYGGFSWELGKKTNADPMPIISGNEITIAFDAQLIEGEGNAILWLHYRSTEVGTNLVQATQRFSLTETTSRFSHTFVIPSHSTNTIDTICVMIGIVDGTIKQARFTNIKVEKGNRATDWSPAPEDITRGTGFYAITTVPSAYTTTTGGFTPAYRIALSTVKTESGLEEVMIGDVIQQGYNTYPVGYVDASYVYLGSANSIRGATGATGLNNAQVILYRRFASAPSGTDIAPTGDVTYTFATGKAVNNLNSWTQNIPTGSNPVYMIAASASNTSATDVIPKTEWSAPVKILENGQNGGTGSAGADGYNQATIFLYQRKSGTAPSKPSSAVTYTFSTGTLSSTPTGWSRTIPANNGNPCYVTTATAVAKTATYSIPANGWSDVVILSQDGEDGTSITITGTSVKYQKGTSGTTAPTGTWGTSIPSVGENEFLWTQTIVNYSDSSKTESYSVSRNAKNGTNGTSPTVSSTTVEYQQSTCGTTPPTGTWTTSAPTATAGQYMWTRTTVKYSDNKTAVSYSVSKNGTNGTSPTAYHLIVSHGAINKSQAGVYNPTTITLTSKSQTGNGALNNYNGRFKIETTTDNSTWTQDSASSTADESSKTYTIPANIKAVRFSLYLAGSFTTLLDQQTVPIVIDGAKGDNGDDAYTIVLTNEAHTFPAGVSAALAGSATSSIMTYKGGIQVACFAGSTSSATSISTGTTGLTCAINNNNSKNVSLTFTATTSLTTKAGTVTIPITVDNKSFSKTFTWSLANQGIKGDDGVSVTNVTSTNNTADGGTSVVTITLSNGTTKTFNVKNGSKGNTGATAQWYYGTSLTHTSGTATLVATSTSGAVVGSMYLNTQTSLVYKCTAVGTNNTWTYAGDLTTGVIDNIEIGGRNLLCNSDQSLTTVSSKGDFYLSETIPTDTTIVVSVQIDADDITWASSGNRRIGFEMSQVTDGVSSGTQYAGVWWSYPKTTFHGRIWNKVKLTRDFPAIIKRYGLYVQGVTGGTYKVSKPKVEIATKPTDWTPAPEDTDASIQQAKKSATNYMSSDNTGIMVADMTDGVEKLPSDTTLTGSNVFITAGYGSGNTAVPAGVHIRDGRTDIARFGATVKIGREDEGHVLIDNDSVDIKKGQDVLASFGESTYIGKNNGYHMLISPNDFIGISDSNAEYFKISGYISTKTLSSNETITETTGYRTGRYFSYRLLNTPLDSSTVSVQEVFYDENYTELNARHFEQVYHYEAPSSDPDMTIWKWEENISEIPAGVGNRPQQQLTIDEELFDQENGLEIGVHLSEVSVKYVVFRVTYKPANSTVAVVNPYYTFGYRKDDYNVGVYSFAEGANIIASGEHSHAEGEDTIASGQGSHAEGAVTTANGDYSHIEGYNGTANGNLSHVEGEACIANGSTSHAQGVGTIADSDAQMVLGRLNMPDSSNKYAVIVGNGDINRRSDAFRLTWDGDLLFFYQNNNPSQGTLDYDLKQAINALNWGGDIIVG